MAESQTATIGRPWKSGWMKRVRIFGLNIYFSNVKLKRRPCRDILTSREQVGIIQRNKDKLYVRQGGACAFCGVELPRESMELHHILPVARFPELKLSIRNAILLCHHCHKEIHLNPFVNSAKQEAKAQELGINLHQRYNIPQAS